MVQTQMLSLSSPQGQVGQAHAKRVAQFPSGSNMPIIDWPEWLTQTKQQHPPTTTKATVMINQFHDMSGTWIPTTAFSATGVSLTTGGSVSAVVGEEVVPIVVEIISTKATKEAVWICILLSIDNYLLRKLSSFANSEIQVYRRV